MRFAVQEDAGIKRGGQLIGVPFAINSSSPIYSLQGFYATTKDGTALPVQFEVLSRYNSGPNDCAAAIRWAYAWVRADVVAQSRGYLVVEKTNIVQSSNLENSRSQNKKAQLKLLALLSSP